MRGEISTQKRVTVRGGSFLYLCGVAFAVFGGRGADGFFEDEGEVGGVREADGKGDFGDGEGGISEEGFCIVYSKVG